MARVSALNGAAWLAIDQGDYAHAAGLLGESIGLSRTLGDTVGEGIATVYLGRCKMSSGRIAEGAPDVERAVALVNEAGDRPAIAFAMFYSALVALLTGSLEAACDLFARCGAHGRRTRPGAAERARPADARLPAAGPGRTVRGQDGAC